MQLIMVAMTSRGVNITFKQSVILNIRVNKSSSSYDVTLGVHTIFSLVICSFKSDGMIGIRIFRIL
jgi:hypothetical protein